MREIVNGIFYVIRLDWTWACCRAICPVGLDLSLVFSVPRRSRFEKINRALVMLDRERSRRHASPNDAIIDSQSVNNDRG
jgi:hypothetical protein